MLEPDEANAVALYCGPRHRDINAFLRGEEAGDEQVRRVIKLIDAAIARNRLATDQVLYRGIDAMVARSLVRSGLRAGSILRDAAYASTSPSLAAARIFSSWPEQGLVLRINAASGIRRSTSRLTRRFPTSGRF